MALIAVALLLMWQPALGTAAEPPAFERLYFYLEGESPAPAMHRWLLDTNSTGDVAAYLVADVVEDPHAGEPMNLTVWWRASSGTSSAMLVVEGVGSVRPAGSVCLWGTDPRRSDFTPGNCGHDAASWTVLPEEGNRTFLAHLTVNGATLNLTRTLAVGPARTVLSAWMVLPAGEATLPEQARADVQLVIGNSGGLPALDHVVDLRYDGRIIATRTVALVPALGNITLPLAFTPVFNATVMEAVVVAGPGAPFLLAAVGVPVSAAAVLTVDSFSVGAGSAEEGSKVAFKATVSNRGNATAMNTSVQFLVDGGVASSAPISGLSPGASSTYRGSWTAQEPGTHAVSARIQGSTVDAQAAALKVTAKAPGAGAIVAALTLALAAALTRGARPSSRSRRA